MTFASYTKKEQYDILVVRGADMILKEYRIKRGYTLEELAEKCEISWRNLQRIENGKDNKAQFETIKKIINELKIDDKEILKYIKQ